MAANAAIYTKYQAFRAIPEDLSDVIELIANEDTPFTANIGRGKAQQVYSEWNTDALASANKDNALVEGEDTPAVAANPTTRVGTYTQIMTKVPAVSGTLNAINIVGGQKALARELTKRGRELKLDREARFVGVDPAVAGTDAVARKTAGFGAWIRTNVSRGVGAPVGANPGMSGTSEGFGGATAGDGFPNSAPTDAGTLRTFTEGMLKTAMASAWASGGKPKMLMLGAALKGTASTFPGIAVNRMNINGVEPAKIIGTADVYLSDFGKLSIVPNNFMRARDAWLIDPEMAEMLTLRPVQTTELSKTGDSEKRLMLWEGSLKVNNEKAHAAIADLQP